VTKLDIGSLSANTPHHLEPLRALTSLTWLRVVFWEASDPHLLSFVSSLPELRFLGIHGRPRILRPGPLWRNGFALGPHLASIGTLSQLLHLEMHKVAREDDVSLITAVCNMPRLTTLDLSFNDELTDQHFATAGPDLHINSVLRRLHVHSCQRLTAAFVQTLPRKMDFICAINTNLTRHALSQSWAARIVL
jgi:hypothetical protein